MKYYQVVTIYDQGRPTGHCVMAENKNRAVQIAEKHDIKDTVYHSDCNVVRRWAYPASEHMVKRRKKHLGGRIWYEDNGNLKYVEKEDV